MAVTEQISIKIIIAYIVGVLGFAGMVWTYASKSTAKDFNVKDLKETTVWIKANMVTKKDVAEVVDSVLVVQLTPIINNQNALRSSYLLHLIESKLSFEKYMKLLNGIEFELNIPRAPDTLRIKITKSNSNGQK